MGFDGDRGAALEAHGRTAKDIVIRQHAKRLGLTHGRGKSDARVTRHEPPHLAKDGLVGAIPDWAAKFDVDGNVEWQALHRPRQVVNPLDRVKATEVAHRDRRRRGMILRAW